MGLLTEEPGWLGQIGRLASSVAGRGAKEETGCEAVHMDGMHWKSFDLADVMEAGLATEITTSFTTAPPPGRDACRLVVERSIDRAQHLLRGEDDEPLLLAVCDEQEQSRISFYVPTGDDPPLALGPAFTLVADDDDRSSWTLTTDRCECCEFLPAPRGCCSGEGKRACRRELARIHHTREDFGQGTTISMEVELPVLRPDSTPSLWCSSSGGAEGKQRLILESRRPSWNARLKSLILDFHGRCSKASIQNVQLDLVTGEEFDGDPPKSGEPELLFGKTGLGTFVLDFRHPLGTVQAFAIALTTSMWR